MPDSDLICTSGVIRRSRSQFTSLQWRQRGPAGSSSPGAVPGPACTAHPGKTGSFPGLSLPTAEGCAPAGGDRLWLWGMAASELQQSRGSGEVLWVTGDGQPVLEEQIFPLHAGWDTLLTGDRDSSKIPVYPWGFHRNFVLPAPPCRSRCPQPQAGCPGCGERQEAAGPRSGPGM